MTSKTAEDDHVAGIQKVLQDSKLECSRTAEESQESSITVKLIMEEAAPEEKAKEANETVDIQVEELPVHEEVITEETPELFPSLSLRQLLPDKLRSIQAENRIHVLPDEFPTDFDPQKIPKISTTMASKYIDILAAMTGCKKYKSSLAEFWFLDTLANLLRRAQAVDLSKQTQAVLIHWFCEWMKEMQHFDAADRPRMIRRFQDNMLAAARFIGDKSYIPRPEDVGVFYKSVEERNQGKASPPTDSLTEKDVLVFEKTGFECSLLDLAHIIHYIFDLFSTDYQFNLVRSVFTFSPDYIRIDAPYQMQNPKRMYAPLKLKKEKPPKKEKTPKGKKQKEVEPEEYVALQELKAKEHEEVEKRNERYREQWNLRKNILPLNMATTEELYYTYWPPPPPAEPDPEPTPDAKKKGKGDRKTPK